MDFRFKYRRDAPVPEELQREHREDSDALRRTRGLALGLSIPMTLLAGPLGGWFLGAWIDQSAGTSYWGFTLLILGVVASLALVVRQLTFIGR